MSRPALLCLAGFGDDASMFDGLKDTELARRFRLVTPDLPGFGGAPPPRLGAGTLGALGRAAAELARAETARVVLAHSVASIVATHAAAALPREGRAILSLEGNLTAEDTYFSGQAAAYSTPEAFRRAFLERLEEMAQGDPILARYRSRVERADPMSLWTLGREAAAFSRSTVPGEALLATGAAAYLYNPDNCPAASVGWLERSGMPSIRLPGASHWATVDVPERVSEAVLRLLDQGLTRGEDDEP